MSVQSRSPPRTRGPPTARGVQRACGIIPQTPLAVGPTGRPGTQQRRRLGDNAPQSDGCHKALCPVGPGSRVQAGEALPASVTHCCSPPIRTPRQFTVPRKPGRSPTPSSRTGSHPGQHAKGSEKSCRTLSEDVRAGVLHLTSPHTRLPNLTHWRGSWAGAGGGKITGGGGARNLEQLGGGGGDGKPSPNRRPRCGRARGPWAGWCRAPAAPGTAAAPVWALGSAALSGRGRPSGAAGSNHQNAKINKRGQHMHPNHGAVAHPWREGPGGPPRGPPAPRASPNSEGSKAARPQPGPSSCVSRPAGPRLRGGGQGWWRLQNDESLQMAQRPWVE